jgi:hypothetical protein
VAEWLCVRAVASCGVDVDGDVLQAVTSWVQDMAADAGPCLEWYLGCRDIAFDKLEAWLADGWKRDPFASPQFEWLDFITPLPLLSVVGMEERLGARLPADLRRVLLEVGDVGMALFDSALGDMAVCCPGDWPLAGTPGSRSHVSSRGGGGGRWSVQLLVCVLCVFRVFHVFFCLFLLNEFCFCRPYSPPQVLRKWADLRGISILGSGGGGDSTRIGLVLRGPCRSQVWVVNSGAGGTVLLHRWDMRPRGHSSDMFQVLASSACMPCSFSEGNSSAQDSDGDVGGPAMGGW